MSDLVLRQQSDLVFFAEEASQVHGIAKALATTSFVPASMKGKPDEITGAILFGRELGMDPMISLQTINVIQGRPTLTANAMRGLAMGAGVKFRLDEATETRCVMSALPPGGDQWTSVTWTIDQAKRLNLTSKENWKNQPGAMLIARATSQLCRLVAANILIGCPYSTEEITDLDKDQSADASVVVAKNRQVKRKPLADVELPEPELIPNEVPDYAQGPAQIESAPPREAQREVGYSTQDTEQRTGPEEPVDRPDMITLTTRKALFATLNSVNLKNRNDRLTYISKVLKRDVVTVNQISEAEGKAVLRALDDVAWVDGA